MRFLKFLLMALLFAGFGKIAPTYAASPTTVKFLTSVYNMSTPNSPTTPTPASQQPASTSVKTLEQTKQELEIEKLRKEVKTDWLKIFTAIGTFIATLGVIATFILGLRQLKQTQIGRDDERFDRAVTRFGGLQPSERLTGLAGIQQFLQGNNKQYQENAISYLVNAAVIESDSTVRSAIVDLFETLPTLKLDPKILSNGLLLARDRNRAAYKRLVDEFWKKQNAAKKRLIDPVYTEVSIGSPSPEELGPLEASAKIIAALVRSGAKIGDLSEIYCVECVFSSIDSPTDLSGVKFDTAILRRAVFSGANLNAASFHNADLILTNFISADLQSAKFTADTPLEPWNISAAQYSGNLASANWGANFSCADLSHADFSGRMVFGLIYENPIYGGAMHDEFQQANLSGTNLSKTQVLLAIPETLVPAPSNGMVRMIPRGLQPFAFAGMSGPGDAVPYFKDQQYLIWSAVWGGQELQSVPFPIGYARDLQIALSSIFAARNVDKAELPQELRSFVNANPGFLKKPASTWNCKPR